MQVSEHALWNQISSALFYGVSSFLITVINKTVLTTYNFPSFQVLGLGQMLSTIIILYVAKKLHYVDFPNLEVSTLPKIFPLPLIYIGNMIFGTLLRRYSTASGNEFADFYLKNHVELTSLQRAVLAGGSAVVSLIDPSRGDMIACLGETTGTQALKYCHQRMLLSPEGAKILSDKPRINTKTVDFSQLKELPDNTLGKIYYDFLSVNKVSPDSRDDVKFIDDTELAYVMQRYREVHDIFHAVLLMPTTMLGEVSVKWVEALQTKLPMCIGGALFGAARLRPRQRKLYVKYHLPWAINTGKNSGFLLNTYFEKRWEQSLDDFHREMNIHRLV
ncbi:ubiquinone biosynthesis protein COQ4 homolog, mitochondrial-like isoform X2 [Microplitis mediator]|uniref:ubiquinone biosynthesis protein COQ4 homolog, mitochondrial-like isoform X2 n=1 Tax=Microplitis mediator TaxID=375433 RepID=UPI0025548F17|nr:ubiquinone biosynthesis protein COQ4 homolog, mitochondrial-like isoform X2 [Microplitis mediator]